jgi:hypothetical protein
MKTIHTFGDSHSYFGWNNVPNINTHHLGPKLCFSIGRDGINISNYGVKENDIVVFCFGEIDCRCHIHKHINNDTTYKQIIDEIVDKYFFQINMNMSLYKNIKMCVYNVVPPIEKHNTGENPDFPYLGSDEERKSYVLYFNEKLKEKCKDNNYIFFDIYDKYIDNNGFLSKTLGDGCVHIKNGIFIEKFVKENLI